MKIIFLGTGANGGTPGIGKSKRLESSVLIKNGLNILIDVTRNFSEQAKNLDKIDAILFTHGHMDACGGVSQLRIWWRQRKVEPIPIYAHVKTINIIKRRYKLLDHCQLLSIKDGQSIRLGSFQITPLKVPHSKDPKFPTFAWKIQDANTIVYASDIAQLTRKFEKFCKGADILIIDGATWKRKIFSHLRVDKDLPKICKWQVNKVVLIQIGKSVPPNEIFLDKIKEICHKAVVGFDGMKM